MTDADALVASHLKLPKYVYVRAFRWQVEYGTADYDDLMSEMKLELIRCSRRFEADRHVRFVTYAFKCLRGRGRDFLSHRAAEGFGGMTNLLRDPPRRDRWLSRHPPLTRVDVDPDGLPDPASDPAIAAERLDTVDAVRWTPSGG